MIRRPQRSSVRGQGLVEFAIVGPLALLLIFALITGSLLFFQNASLHDGATAGARMASIETSLTYTCITGDSGCTAGQVCETRSPASIEQTIADSVPGLIVNKTSRLCEYGGSTTQLTQNTSPSNGVTITVTGSPSLAAPTSVTVTLSYVAHGIVPPFSTSYSMSASSTVPVESP